MSVRVEFKKIWFIFRSINYNIWKLLQYLSNKSGTNEKSFRGDGFNILVSMVEKKIEYMDVIIM